IEHSDRDTIFTPGDPTTAEKFSAPSRDIISFPTTWELSHNLNITNIVTFICLKTFRTPSVT
ncbi:hypothetical protein J6590_100249, partial [Homalodisca vitripennis]